MTGAVTAVWGILRQDVKGFGKSHSQDRHLAQVTAGGQAALLAVADGHGSAAHFRSDLGARWAVEEFAHCAEDFARQVVNEDSPAGRWPRLHGTARELPRQLVRCWRQRVARHEANAPADGRLAGAAATAAARRPVAYEVYGSTLVGAVVTPRLLVCWQLGDGDAVLVGPDGRPETPLDTGPDIGDETESLCQAEAWRRTRVLWRPLTGGGPPPAVLLSTDGLSKSFTDRAGFLGFAGGVRQRVAEQGVDAIQEQLAGWLAQAATHSGDDTTLVGAFPATPSPPGQPPEPKGRTRTT